MSVRIAKVWFFIVDQLGKTVTVDSIKLILGE